MHVALTARGVRHGDGGRVGVGVLEGEAEDASGRVCWEEGGVCVCGCDRVWCWCRCRRRCVASASPPSATASSREGWPGTRDPRTFVPHIKLKHTQTPTTRVTTHDAHNTHDCVSSTRALAGALVGRDRQQFGGYWTGDAGETTAPETVTTLFSFSLFI